MNLAKGKAITKCKIQKMVSNKSGV